MKVKNIMFSGFMAAVLAGACGAADAATVLASKEFVTTELGKKQDTLTAGTNIAIDPDTNTISSTYEYNDSALSQKVTDLETTIGALPENTTAKTIVEYVDKQTEGLATDGKITELQNSIDVVEGDVSAIEDKLEGLPADKTVAQEIAAAVGGKQDKLEFDATPTENSTNPVTSGGVYTALSGKANVADIPTVPTKVSEFTNDANYVTSTVLDGKGYQTAENVATAIEDAEIEMSQVTGLGAALDGKAATDTVSALSDKVDGLADKAVTTDNMTTTLAGYATDAELGAVSAVANAAQTAEQVKNTVEGYGYQTSGQVESAITAKGYATKTYVDDQDDATLQAAKDDAATKYQVKGKYMVDPADKGTYLVTRAEDGTISYSAVQVVGANDTILLQ